MAAPKNNLYALGNTGGAPRKYETPEDLEARCDEYFKFCIETKENPKITGLALFLGFCDRQSLFDYEKLKEFSCIIKRAKLGVESHYEDGLNTFKYGGSVFALKNMGWKDQQEQTIHQTITTVTPMVISSDTPLSNSESQIKDV